MVIRRELLIQLCIVLWLGFCPPLQSQTTPSESAGSEVLATVERSGGFAGIHEEFTIFKVGRVVKDSGATYRIPHTELHVLIRGMMELDVPKSCRIGISAGLCFDCFVYRITLRYPSGSRVITLNELGVAGYESASTLARSLRALVSKLK